MRVNKPYIGSCWVFKHIANHIWLRIVAAHSYGIDLSEIGLTKDIMVMLLQFHNQKKIGLDVFVKPGYKEAVYGSDIDLFVEISPNSYVWFALQAKILKRNGRYTTLRDGKTKTNPTYQWEKLHVLERMAGCKGYFLLYNGKDNFNHSGKDICGKGFKESQYGCSLVDLNTIKTFALKKNITSSNYINPTFEDIHPKYAQPWRVLVCCPIATDGLSTYSIETITQSSIVMGFERNLGNEGVISDNIPIDNEIVKAMQESRWEPEFRVVVKMKDSKSNN